MNLSSLDLDIHVIILLDIFFYILGYIVSIQLFHIGATNCLWKFICKFCSN